MMITKKQVLNLKKHRNIGLMFPEILYYYGFTPDDALCWNDDQIRLACPVHHSDNKTSFSWSQQYLTWACFSHRCHERHGNSALAFIMCMEDCDRKEAYKIAKEIWKNTDVELITKRQKMLKSLQQTTHQSQNKLLDVDVKDVMFSAYATYRGIPRHIQEKYYVGTHVAAGLQRLSVPIFDINEQLVGLSARVTSDSYDGPKWIHLPKGFRSNVNLYNIHKVRPKKGKIILTEGPLDVLRFEAANIHNSVSTLGSSLSQEQVHLLGSLKVSHVIIAYDNDSPGEKGARRAAKLLKEYEYKVSRMRWNVIYKDIGEMPISCLKRRQWKISRIGK